MRYAIRVSGYDGAGRLQRAWEKRGPLHVAGAPPGVDLRAALTTHLEAHGATLRRGSDVAAIVAIICALDDGEILSQEAAENLVEQSVAWLRAWVGSEPLALRSGPIKGEPSPRGTPRTPPRGLNIEVVVSPIREQRHRGGTSLRVSVNQALHQLTEATLGSGSKTRHAEALHASWTAHLRRAVPELGPKERPPTARQLLRKVATLEDLMANVEDLRERQAELEAVEREVAAREACLRAFPAHIEASLRVLDQRIKDGSPETAPVREMWREMPDAVKAFYRRQQLHFKAVVDDPTLGPGFRLCLEMILGEIGYWWDSNAAKAANTQPNPDTGTAREPGQRVAS